MYSAIALVPACGSRKVNINKESLETKTETNTNLNQQSDKYGAITTQEESFNANTRQNQAIETIKTREYDKDTGKLTKEQETTRNVSSNETTINKNKTVRNTLWRQTDKLSIVKKTVNKTNWRTKTKTITNNRYGLPLVLLVLGIAGLAFWLKPWIR